MAGALACHAQSPGQALQSLSHTLPAERCGGMPIRLGPRASAVRQGGANAADKREVPKPSTAGSTAQDAKVSAVRWMRESGSGNRDTPPWFTPDRQFTAARNADPRGFEAWRGAFDKTDMGHFFGAPAPEPLSPLPGDSTTKTGNDNTSVEVV